MNECSVPAMNQVLLRAQGKNLRKFLTHCLHMLFLPFGAGSPWPEWRRLTGASPHPTGGRVCRFSPRSSVPGPSFISCTSNIEHLRWDRGAGWRGCQKTAAVGMRVRWHPQPPQLRLWSVIWFLTARPVSNRLSSRPYLPRGSWKCRKSGVRLFLDLICIRFILLGFVGAMRLFVFQQKWRLHGQSENG
jgi:hypothetical protein